MRATIEYVAAKFDEFNALCFESKLVPPPFIISHSRRALGMIVARRKRLFTGRWHYYDFRFKISDRIDLDERIVEDIILHEMIHYYILSKQIEDTSKHGDKFRHMMQEINTKYGRNISISQYLTAEQSDTDRIVRRHYICVIHLKDGRVGLLISMKSRIFELWSMISLIRDADHWEWYLSTDSYFNRFKRTSRLSLYFLPASELQEHLQGATPLKRSGNTIYVVNR